MVTCLPMDTPVQCSIAQDCLYFHRNTHSVGEKGSAREPGAAESRGAEKALFPQLHTQRLSWAPDAGPVSPAPPLFWSAWLTGTYLLGHRELSVSCVLGLHDGLKQTSLMGKTALPRRPCVGALKSKAAAIDATCDSHHLPNVFVWGVLVKATSKTRPHETTGGRVIVSIYWWIDRPECWGWDPGFEDARFVPGLWAATAYSENCSFKAPGPGWYVTEHPVAHEVLIQASEKPRFTPNCHLLL